MPGVLGLILRVGVFLLLPRPLAVRIVFTRHPLSLDRGSYPVHFRQAACRLNWKTAAPVPEVGAAVAAPAAAAGALRAGVSAGHSGVGQLHLRLPLSALLLRRRRPPKLLDAVQSAAQDVEAWRLALVVL